MARGYMYEICTDRNDVGSFGESDLYESINVLNVDYVQDVADEDEAKYLVDSFIKMLSKNGAIVGAETIETWDGKSITVPYFILTDEVRRNFFHDRYIRMKKMAAEITEDEFAMDLGFALFDLRQCIKDTTGDMVYFDGLPEELDSFLRTAPGGSRYPSGIRFYVRNVVLLH